MRRSRIFLGATTCLLAVAGVAAAKMSAFRTTTVRYYCTKPGTAIAPGHCVTYTLQNCVANGPTFTCKYPTTTLGQKKYTLYIGNTVTTNTLCFPTSTPVNCVTKLMYDTIVE